MDNPCKFKIEKKEFFLVVIMLAVYFVQKLFLSKLGIYMEECRDANAHLMVLDGKVPYKDFHFWVYGPFIFCFYPLIFKIFGAGLFVFRLSFIAIGALAVPLVYVIARRLMSKGWAITASFLSIVLIDVPYYTYNHIFATVAGLCALLFIIKFMERNVVRYILFAGIFIGIALLVKPFLMGLGILLSILLFMLFLKFKEGNAFEINFRHFILLLSGASVTIIPFLAYFIIHDAFWQLLANITPLGPDRVGSFYVYPRFLPQLFNHLNYFINMIPYEALFSPSQWKDVLVMSYYRQLLYLPVMVPLVIFLLNKFVFSEYGLISKTDSRYIVLFTMFSIFISGQSFVVLGLMGRSFTMQVPFLLFVYLLSLINNKKLYDRHKFRRYTVLVLSGFLVFYLSFLHFFRYPYSRSKTYNVELGLERARHIKVTPEEKTLYESLNKFLDDNLSRPEPIAVIGYYPQFAFLLNRENIFGDIEDVCIKFMSMQESGFYGHEDMENINITENKVLDRLEERKPAFLISPVIPERKYLTSKILDYINQHYALEKTFGPAYIDIYTLGIVKVYRRLSH